MRFTLAFTFFADRMHRAQSKSAAAAATIAPSGGAAFWGKWVAERLRACPKKVRSVMVKGSAAAMLSLPWWRPPLPEVSLSPPLPLVSAVPA